MTYREAQEMLENRPKGFNYNLSRFAPEDITCIQKWVYQGRLKDGDLYYVNWDDEISATDYEYLKTYYRALNLFH